MVRKTKWSEVAQSCLTFCNPMDCILPGSSVHGIFQARVLEWTAISFSWASSRPRNQTRVSRIAGRRFTVWATREAWCNLSTTGYNSLGYWSLIKTPRCYGKLITWLNFSWQLMSAFKSVFVTFHVTFTLSNEIFVSCTMFLWMLTSTVINYKALLWKRLLAVRIRSYMCSRCKSAMPVWPSVHTLEKQVRGVQRCMRSNWAEVVFTLKRIGRMNSQETLIS